MLSHRTRRGVAPLRPGVWQNSSVSSIRNRPAKFAGIIWHCHRLKSLKLILQDKMIMSLSKRVEFIDDYRRDKANRYAVVLAGGDGTRLRSITKMIAGDDRPKQFC